MKLKLEKEKANGGKDGNKKGAPVVETNKEEEEDNLITFREYMHAIRSLKSLYKTILPRTLSFKEVLMTVKNEETFSVSDSYLDEFGMFRYEMNSIFKRH